MSIRRVLSGLVVSALVLLSAQAPVAEAAPARRPAKLGGLIVFGADQTSSSQLYTVRPDGSQLRQITHLTDGDAVSPDWSPDGRRIVFELGTPDTGKIAIVNADGTGLSVLPLAGTILGQPSFTADGQGVVFERFDGVSDDALFVARLDARRSGDSLRRRSVTATPSRTSRRMGRRSPSYGSARARLTRPCSRSTFALVASGS